MTVRSFLSVLICAAVSLIPITSCSHQKFPEWRGAAPYRFPYGAWESSTLVAVGQMRHVNAYGEQTADRFPAPMSPLVHRLYWCAAEFDVVALIKGERPSSAKRYVWAQVSPGCNLWIWPDNPRAVDRSFQTRAWFFREDGEFLRPPFDSGTYPYLGLTTKWKDVETIAEARRELGTLLLTPSANAADLDEYAGYLASVINIACELLPKTDCAAQVRSLADLGSPRLREEACGLLNGELGQNCMPSRDTLPAR
ncbi:MAG TPA: hypothetical protein VG456_06045 [Candidatus Sulfopaludibacter sp.]|nr:hypothetical protein [Candidatus Sulfopaludibacter sp.]